MLSSYRLKKINKEKVKPIRGSGKEEKRPVRGKGLFPEVYANIFICAKKKSGKTTLIYNILKKCAGPDTRLVFCVSTFEKDETYVAMNDYFLKKGNEIEIHNSFSDAVFDVLYEEEDSDPIADEEKIQPICPFLSFDSSLKEDAIVEEKPVKKRKSQKLSPEIIFIFDDQGSLLRNQKITDLLKKNRHYRTKVIISSQYIHDLQPGALKQLDYMIVFGGQPVDKLKLIHKHLDLSLDFDLFHNIYKGATKEKYNFLYIDTTNEKYRKNLDKEFSI